MTSILFNHTFSGMKAATDRRPDVSSTTAIRSVHQHRRHCWSPASPHEVHVTSVQDIKMKLVSVFSSALEAIIALWRNGCRRIFELCVIRSGATAVRAATTPVLRPSDSNTSHPQFFTADHVDGELFTKLKCMNWQDIPVFDDDEDSEDEDDDDDENDSGDKLRPKQHSGLYALDDEPFRAASRRH